MEIVKGGVDVGRGYIPVVVQVWVTIRRLYRGS